MPEVSMNGECSNRPKQLLQSRQNIYKHKNSSIYIEYQKIKCELEANILAAAVNEVF
jgi:hypothetical protein